MSTNLKKKYVKKSISHQYKNSKNIYKLIHKIYDLSM